MQLSNRYADAAWWEPVYRQFFPGFDTMVNVRKDGWVQRSGVDRHIILSNGKIIKVDEKVRSEDYADILLEYWSNYERRVRGWVARDQATQYLTYAFIPSQRALLLPFDTLRRAWATHHVEWVRQYRRIEAYNERYTTISVAVPIDVLFAAIRGAMFARWSDADLQLGLKLNTPALPAGKQLTFDFESPSPPPFSFVA